MKKILAGFIIWFLVLNALNILSSRVLFDSTSYELPGNITISPRHVFVPWLNFDGRNYLEIAAYGYNHPYRLDLRVFFPLYPLLVRIISLDFHFYPVLAGLMISFFSFLGSLFVFHKLLKLDGFAKKERDRALLLLLLFPTSFFFLAFYTESLFLLLAMLTFYFLKKKDFLRASIFTALATATRVTGLALIPGVLWEAYQSYKKTKKVSFSVLLTPLGFVFYMIYTQLTSGNALSIIQSQKDWNRPIGILGPFYAFKEGLLHAVYGSSLGRLNPVVHFIEQVEFVAALSILIFLAVSFRKIKTSYWLYAFSSAVFMFFSGILSSVPRYVIVLFPLYSYLAKKLPGKIYYAICVLFFILLVILASLFLRGYWVA